MADVQPLKFGPLGEPQQCGPGDTLPRSVLPAATVYSDAATIFGVGQVILCASSGDTGLAVRAAGQTAYVIQTQAPGGATRFGFIADSTLDVYSDTSTQSRICAGMGVSWANATDASRAGRLRLTVYSLANAQEGLRIEGNSGGVRLGFFGAAAAAKPAVTGSRGMNPALASLLTALASLGLITDSTST